MLVEILLVGLICSLSKAENSDYFINTTKCKMFKYKPFDEEVSKFYVKEPPIDCAQNSSVKSFLTIVSGHVFLNIKELVEHKIDFCCYHYILRKGTPAEPDVGFRVGPCQQFIKKIRVMHPNILVNCFSNKQLVYENVHFTHHLFNANVQNKMTQAKSRKRGHLSVLFLVIDAVSRNNFQRTMPLTRNFLLNNKFVEMAGYNKVDDNTFPNAMALLTGMSLDQVEGRFDGSKVGQLDRCKMIWYDYRNLGYLTAYAEDWSYISTFNYLKKGFKNPPTDFYYKPYVEAADALNVTIVDTMPYCSGPEGSGQRILNLLEEFSIKFKDYPTFGIFWMNTFSHNYINSPSRMDKEVRKVLQTLKARQVFNKTAVVVLSDHGIRFGPIRKTKPGWFEERTPINFISLPNWFKLEYPNYFCNLVDNSKKLTSTYDMYMTLQHILKLYNPEYTITPSKGCLKCSSLLEPLPSRSCADSGIPSKWCTCFGQLKDLNDTTLLWRLCANYIHRNMARICNTKRSGFSSELTIDVINGSISEFSLRSRLIIFRVSCIFEKVMELRQVILEQKVGRSVEYILSIVLSRQQLRFT